jgi:hypothetical protein
MVIYGGEAWPDVLLLPDLCKLGPLFLFSLSLHLSLFLGLRRVFILLQQRRACHVSHILLSKIAQLKVIVVRRGIQWQPWVPYVLYNVSSKFCVADYGGHEICVFRNTKFDEINLEFSEMLL